MTMVVQRLAARDAKLDKVTCNEDDLHVSVLIVNDMYARIVKPSYLYCPHKPFRAKSFPLRTIDRHPSRAHQLKKELSSGKDACGSGRGSGGESWSSTTCRRGVMRALPVLMYASCISVCASA